MLAPRAQAVSVEGILVDEGEDYSDSDSTRLVGLGFFWWFFKSIF